MSEFSTSVWKSPLGDLVVVEEKGALVACCLKRHFPTIRKQLALPPLKQLLKAPRSAGLRALEGRLKNYFSGKLNALQGVKRGKSGTPFQQAVWGALSEIRAGELRSYKQIAKRVSRPKAVRAVGSACGANPFLLFVPCHRVVAASGQLGGFSSGLDNKLHLLSHENVLSCSCPNCS